MRYHLVVLQKSGCCCVHEGVCNDEGIYPPQGRATCTNGWHHPKEWPNTAACVRDDRRVPSPCRPCGEHVSRWRQSSTAMPGSSCTSCPLASRTHGVAWGPALRASASYSVVRLTPKVRHIAALLAPAAKAAWIAARFSSRMAWGRPPRFPRRLAAAKAALTRSWVKTRSYGASVPHTLHRNAP